MVRFRFRNMLSDAVFLMGVAERLPLCDLRDWLLWTVDDTLLRTWASCRFFPLETT